MARKTRAQLDREIADVLSRRGHATKSSSYDKDDARRFGQYAYRMEQTKAKALASAKAEGFAAHQLGAVEEGWEGECRDTVHGGFAVHATKKKSAPRPTPYRIKLTPSELRAVEFARGRYAWPDMLAAHAAEDGSIAFTESEMWAWTDDVDSDAEGGHSPFPLASGAFAEKLQLFYDSRV